jgi:carbon-monoxide dehydrogenase large subunit
LKPGSHPGGVTRYIGASVRRVEDPRLISGRGQFLDDIRFDGLLHAAFVRSPHAHAIVRAVDPSDAKRAPAVHGVLTGQDLASSVRPLSPRFGSAGFTSTAWPALARDRVRFVGEPVAVVAAESAYAAVDARERVVVTYEPLPALADVTAAIATGAPRLHAG